MTEFRTRPAMDLVFANAAFGATPGTRRELYRLMQTGETLVTAVHGFSGLMYDGTYRYRAEHRPARAWAYGFHAPSHLDYGADDAPAWLAGMLRDGVAAAMVYTDSAEDRVLRAPGSGYACVYEQIAAENVCGIRIYRRLAS
jgi:hypothetical protein